MIVQPRISKLIYMTVMCCCIKLAYTKPVVVTNITDPTFINMSMQSMQTNAQMLSQLASSVQNIQYNYQAVTANNNLTASFASFAGIFSTISTFMKNYICQDCPPGLWDRNQYELFERDFCKNIAHILGTGADVFSNVGQLAQDINRIMNLSFTNMNPAQMAATQAQLMGSLGTGVQQTNTLLNSSMQMQTQAMAKEQMQSQAARMQMKSSFQNMQQQIKP